jgi:hypothetical protein
MALTRRHLNTIYDIIDEFYPAQRMLRQYKHDEDAPFGFIMCVTVRAKIYENIQDLINRYKRGQDYTALLNRVLRQLKLHRYQVERLSKTNPGTDYQSVKRFCIALASLIHIAFREKEIPD